MMLDNRIKKLQNYHNDSQYVATLYIKLEPEDRNNFQYKTVLKNLIKQAKNNYSYLLEDEELSKTIGREIKKIEAFIDSTKNIEGLRGLALFSCIPDGLWEVFGVPHVYKNRLFFNHQPHLGELMSQYEKHGNILLLAVDKHKARLFKLTPEVEEEISGVLFPGASRTHRFQATEGKFKQRVASAAGGTVVSQGYGEYSFNRTIENDIHQHFKYLSDQIFEYHKESSFDWLIVGGSDQSVNDFLNHIHSYIKPKVLGTIRLDVDTLHLDKIAETSLHLLDDLRYRNNCRLVDEFEEKLSSGLAVNGVEPCLEALYNGQARILLVDEAFARPGYLCTKSNLLLLEAQNGACPESQPPHPVEDMVDYMIEEAYGQNCEVDMVFDPQLKEKIHGMASILRFKM